MLSQKNTGTEPIFKLNFHTPICYHVQKLMKILNTFFVKQIQKQNKKAIIIWVINMEQTSQRCKQSCTPHSRTTDNNCSSATSISLNYWPGSRVHAQSSGEQADGLCRPWCGGRSRSQSGWHPAPDFLSLGRRKTACCPSPSSVDQNELKVQVAAYKTKCETRI